MKFQELYTIITQRKTQSIDDSYTARLVGEGLDRVTQKVGEEAVEVVIASKNDDKAVFISEVSDLMYHLLVLMSVKDVTLEDIEVELERRHDAKN